MQSLSTRLKYTEQYCMSNIIATHLVSSTVILYNNTCIYKPESQRVPQEYRELSLRIEKKPRSSKVRWCHGLSGGIDATAHACAKDNSRAVDKIFDLGVL